MLSFIFNELTRQYIMGKRYMFSTIVSYLFLVIVFVSSYMGLDMIVSKQDVDFSLDIYVIGFLIFGLAMSSYSGITSNVSILMGESLSHEMYLSKYSFAILCIIRCVIEVIKSIIIFLLLLNFHRHILGNYFEVNYFTLGISLVFAVPSLIGIGFGVSALLMVFKKIGVIQPIMITGIITLISINVETNKYLALLPFSYGASIAKKSLSPIFQISSFELAIITINSLFYLILGLTLYKFSEKYVLRKGMLDHG